MSSFDEYIRQGEPGRSVKAAAWQTAIGLQDVDGLKPSSYLIDTAKRHIEGDVTIEEVKGLIDTYYKSRQGRWIMILPRNGSSTMRLLLPTRPLSISALLSRASGRFTRLAKGIRVQRQSS